MLKRSFTIEKLLLVCTGAMIGLGAIEQVNEVFAQSSTVSTQSQVTRDKVNNSGSTKNKVVTSTTKNKLTSSTTAKAKVTKAPVVTNRLPHSAKDLKDKQVDLFASPIAFKTSSSISLPTKLDSNLVDIAQSTQKVAQSGTTTSNSPDLIRQQLLIRPITTQTTNVFIKRIYTPSLNAGTPVGFGLETGDAFIGIFGSTAGRLRDTVDGSISMGTGLGDASKYLAVEGVFNINSIRNFGSNGSFDLKVHRIVYEDFYRQVGVSVGWTNFANYGTNAGGTPSSVYGAATISQLTDPENLDSPKPLIATLGVGGGTYRKSTSNGGVGVFANLGYQFAPQWGASTAWSGQGLNFGVGFLPDPTLPLNITLTYSDVTNNSDAGTQLILGVSYGFNYTGRK
ncbi:hypothetical protein [Pseudanabaena yagii]|uniref:Porin n=1 Tax=Pseudanabaena yagii GIHE-NHR1 TaxID=2722753 RepID=A0ABX1LR25_9CYAN|nr:hypothetical protein [Pseudanabaena yagii]NMF57796.1 hypothetical protein [Pseudanabaena yagii GIHE-NHR1]